MYSEGPAMIVECLTCPVRGHRCDDCVVTVLLGPGLLAPGPAALTSPVERTLTTELLLDAAENRAVSMFVGAGLVNAETAAGLYAIRETAGRRGAVRAVG